jgi:hypothetical protein
MYEAALLEPFGAVTPNQTHPLNEPPMLAPAKSMTHAPGAPVHCQTTGLEAVPSQGCANIVSIG